MTSTTPRVAGTERHRQILRVAKQLFAQLGFEGTTTRRIAERARVNEAILFRHFPRKEDLYWAVVENECRRTGKGKDLEKKLSASREDREVFQSIAEEILRHCEEDPTWMRLLLFTALENHRLSRRFFECYVAEKYEILAGYIRRRVREKVFRPVDAQLAARSFVGMVVYHVMLQELFGGKYLRRFDPRLVSRTLTKIWLEGMKARSRRPTASRRTHESL